jgi:fermentation-respiration switch protein FrsA (DUF1100 family)
MAWISKRGIRNTALSLAGLFLVAYAAATAYLYVYQDELLFPDRPTSTKTPLTAGFADFSTVQLAVGQEKSEAWFIPNARERGVVLLSHGNGQTMGERLEMAKAFHELGFSIFLYEYGGYWNSTGEPSETRCYDDARAAWKYLTEDRNYTEDKILLFGESMGTAPSVELARTNAPGAIVLLSPFTSMAAIASDLYPLVPMNLLLRHRFDNVAKVPKITAPLLILHGVDDTIVPFSHGQKLYQLANNPKELVRLHGDHAAFYQDMGAFKGAVKDFVDPLFPMNSPTVS